MNQVHLVMGASGFLGSHVTRQLVEQGYSVRVFTRPSSSTRAIDGLGVEHVTGELTDDEALAAAMAGVDTVHYCIVDTRAWVNDVEALFKTNVDGLQHALDAAVAVGVRRFVFCSTVGTLAISDSGLVTEDQPHNWVEQGGGYIASRKAAEDLVLSYVAGKGLPAVILNVSTTYGPQDWGPSPHGGAIKAVARGKMPVYVRGVSMEVVSIVDAAKAFPLAAEKGVVGERYIISERFLPIQELFEIAADEAGIPAPKWGLPLAVMKVAGVAGDAFAKVARKESPITVLSVRLMHIMTALDHSKAERELGWEPTPTPDAVRAQVRFFLDQPQSVR